MSFLNVEIKARCSNTSFIRNYLVSKNANLKGVDKQTDTYFNVQHGRLKLREGNIENNLIFYNRDNKAGPKNSHFKLVIVSDTFEGMRKVQRHQKLYQLFANDLKNGIHALALHLYTKSEWESLGEAFPKSPNCLGVGQ
mgnify:CR=1 FL=1